VVADVLTGAGCQPVLACLGARAEDAAGLLPATVQAVVVDDWRTGLSASLRAAMRAAAHTGAEAALILPVDVPDMPIEACARLLRSDRSRSSLARAVYRGAPGHPVLIGRDHWLAVADGAVGDRGAGAYLSRHGAAEIECADLWDGADIDTPQD